MLNGKIGVTIYFYLELQLEVKIQAVISQLDLNMTWPFSVNILPFMKGTLLLLNEFFSLIGVNLSHITQSKRLVVKTNFNWHS